MIELKRVDLERALNIKFKKHGTCLGVDTASKTGWCIAKIKGNNVTLDFSVIEIKSKNIYFKYNQMLDQFESLINGNYDNDFNVIIEEVYVGRNRKGAITLARFGMIVYSIAHKYGVPKKFVSAVTARASLGLPHNSKKDIVQEDFIRKTQLKIQDPDVIDAVILALNGLVEEKEMPRLLNAKGKTKKRKRKSRRKV